MAKNIMIYKGITRLLYAKNVKVEKEKIIPIVQKEIADDNALFYKSFGHYINMEHACLLPDEEEATMFMNQAIENRQVAILELLKNPNLLEEDRKRFMDYLSSVSSCLYFNASDITPSYSLSKNDFKEFRKHYDNKKR